jgi:hypothetical protein
MKRSVLWITCAVLALGLVVGCAARFHTGGTITPCARDGFAQCESALWESFERSDRAQLEARLRLYLGRRSDGWSRLYQEFLALRNAPRPVSLPPLPPPATLSPERLLLLFAEGAGLEHVVLLREGGTRWHLHGRDPLRPFLLGLPAVLIDSGSPAEASEDVALEHEVRRAFTAASAGSYGETAAAVDRLRTALTRQHGSATLLRAHYALRLFSSAGLALSPLEPATGTSALSRELAGKRSHPTTPYAEMLRVLLSSEPAKEWALRRDVIEPALLPARRAALLRHFGGRDGCQAEAPTISSLDDLFFAGTLGSALAPPGTLPGRGELAFSQWLPRYRTLVQRVSEAGAGWYFAPILAQHRGLKHGVNADEDATFQAVTAMMHKHIEALRGLQAVAPQRFEEAGAATWLLWDELRADSTLLMATAGLLDRALRGKLEAGSETTTIWDGLFTGFFTTLGLSGAAQQVAIQALHLALTERLRGDLRERSGWSVAGLYAIDEIFRQLFGLPSELAFDGDQILRALRENEVAYPELARLAQAATLYLTLAASGDLDAALLGEPKSFGSARQEAYDALRLAVAALAPNAAPPAEVTAEVALFVDGVLSLAPLAVKPELARRRFFRPGAGEEDELCPSPPTPPTREMQRALGRLSTMRQRLLGRAWYRGGAETVWAPRLRALLLLLSDGLDLAQRGAGGVEFAIPTSTAQTQVRQAVQGVASGPFAHLGGVAADLYQLLRRYAGRRAGEPGPLSGASPEALRALLGLWQGVLGGDARAAPDSLIALLGGLPLERLRTSGELPALCAELSAALFEKGQAEAGEGLLLAGLFAAHSLRQPASDALVEVGARHHSRLLPLLKLYQTGFVARTDKPLDHRAFRDGLRALAADSCQETGVDQTMEILQALGDYASGERVQARAALRRSLEAAERNGLSVPQLAAQYAEQVGTRRLQLKLDLNFSGSLAQAGSVGQLSVGVSSLTGATRELRLDFQPETGGDSDERALRLYVHAAALYTVYSLIDGDQAAGRFGGGRLLSAMGHLLRLGKRGGGDPKQGVSWDARAAVAVAAQLLAETGQPLLASELWRDVQAALEHAIKKEDDGDPFGAGAPEMLGLAKVPGIAKLVERTRTSLRRLEPSCRRPARPARKAATALSCADYGVELSLRHALKQELDALLSSEEAARCPALALFQPATQQALARELKELGQPMEAAEAALYRIKTSPYVALKVASDLRRSPELPPWLRASMLEGQVLFDTKIHGQPNPDDLGALLADSAQVPGLSQHGRVLRQVVDYAAAKNGLGPLAEAALAPDFVSRWLVPALSGGPAEEAATALLLQQAAALESDRTVDRAMTQGAVNVLCGSSGSLSDKTLRGALCIEIHKLHASPGGRPEARSRAQEVYRFLSSKTADFQR